MARARLQERLLPANSLGPHTTHLNLALQEVYKAFGQTAETASVASPTGTVAMFAGTTAPAGWLICDGSTVSQSDYQDLYDVIGSLYGAAGAGSFKLPDLRDQFVRGANPTVAASGGATTHNHPAHTQATQNNTSVGGAANRVVSEDPTHTAANHIPPFIALHYIIKT